MLAMRNISLFIAFSIYGLICYGQQGIGVIGVRKTEAPPSRSQESQEKLQQLLVRQQANLSGYYKKIQQNYAQVQGARNMAALTEVDRQQFAQIDQSKDSLQHVLDSTKEIIDSLNGEIAKLQNPPAVPTDINLKDSLKTIGLYGVGNLNTESFNNVNAAGKLAGYFRPYMGRYAFTTVYFTYNKNASNTDSLLAGNFLFPDVGNNSFALTVQHSILLNRKDFSGGNHLFVPAVEFSLKSINGQNADSTRSFTSLNFAASASYMYWKHTSDADFYFSIGPLLAINKVPEKYSADYKYLFRTDTLSNTIVSAGVKASLQINQFVIYADCRNVFGSKDKIASDALRGFNYTIGVIFNANIFEW
jgi:hypothetical protein